ncbi:MAG: class III signal peptide-containing protein [Candidatus Micrarchaeia archaeon]
MSFHTRRGQGAFEYLLLLGGTVLVSILVILVMSSGTSGANNSFIESRNEYSSFVKDGIKNAAAPACSIDSNCKIGTYCDPVVMKCATLPEHARRAPCYAVGLVDFPNGYGDADRNGYVDDADRVIVLHESSYPGGLVQDQIVLANVYKPSTSGITATDALFIENYFLGKVNTFSGICT